MSEEMQPIDPITAAMLMGQVPEPCEPIIEISHKVLTHLMDVVEFGDQLERVEKDRLLAHLKDVLAADQPELWAMYSPGPGEVHPMISKEEAERHASELLALCKERCPTVPITINVIPSPFSPLEHFELLAEETIQHRNDLLEYVKELEDAAKHKTAVLVAQENLHLQAVNCPHSINEHEVVLRFDPTQPGHNALNQLARRLSEALKPAELDGISTTLAMPAGLHPDTQDLVTRFATALAVKLHAAELKHGYSDGWKEPHWMDECRQKLIDHLAKGDPRDVAAYCAFLWHHCQSTSAHSKPCTWKRDEDTGAYSTGCGQTWSFTDGGDAEEHGALFCHHCAGLIVVERRQLFAYQVGDNDIVAAYDPAGAIKVLVEFSGLGDLDDYDESDVDLVSDKVLDATEAYDIDEGKTVTLEKTLRQELAELTEPAYLHGWE